jgi:hypothetical protein
VSKEVFTLCGCVEVKDEAEARALQKMIRALGGKGFSIQGKTTHDDGSETTRKVVA